MSSSDEFNSYKSDSTPIISNVKQNNGTRRQKIGLDVELTAPAFALVYALYMYKNILVYFSSFYINVFLLFSFS